MDLIVKYQAADASNTNQAYQDNVAVMKALVLKYPEVRDAFVAVVARAVDPGGRDYGTLTGDERHQVGRTGSRQLSAAAT